MIFSKLGLQSGYQQVPVDPVDQEKTAACPGRDCFSLPGSLLVYVELQAHFNANKQGLSFVSTYIDDVLIHSKSEELHTECLQDAFKRLRQATLTLWGVTSNRLITSDIPGNGMSSNSNKILLVTKWSKPADAGEVGPFLGLDMYYQHYINRFTDHAAPLS